MRANVHSFASSNLLSHVKNLPLERRLPTVHFDDAHGFDDFRHDFHTLIGDLNDSRSESTRAEPTRRTENATTYRK